jgi:Spy/CpxP family protein refolding chaperone
MKKILITMIVLMMALVIVNGAIAWGGPGNGMRGGYGCPYAANLTPEQAQKLQEFQKSVEPLQQQIFQLRNEIRTLRNQQNPDWNAISAKQKEMIDLRTQIQKQAMDSGFAGAGYGTGMRGRGMGRF